MTGAIQELAQGVWDARERRALKRDAREVSRALALGMAHDVKQSEVYDPETDVRVKWLREVIADMRSGPAWRQPRGSVDAEYGVLFVLGRLETSGKEKAAGA